MDIFETKLELEKLLKKCEADYIENSDSVKQTIRKANEAIDAGRKRAQKYGLRIGVAYHIEYCGLKFNHDALVTGYHVIQELGNNIGQLGQMKPQFRVVDKWYFVKDYWFYKL